MIKNDIQLTRARDRFRTLTDELEQLEQQHAGNIPEYLAVPILRDRRAVEKEIAEYEALRASSLQEAVDRTLARPVPLEDVAELLAKLRIAAGLTQADLADRLGWAQSNLSRFESADNGSQTIRKISEYLDGLGVWLHVRPSLSEEVKLTTSRRRYLNFPSDFHPAYAESFENALAHKSKLWKTLANWPVEPNKPTAGPEKLNWKIFANWSSETGGPVPAPEWPRDSGTITTSSTISDEIVSV